MLNFSPASERNKAAILAVLKHQLGQCRRVLEVGSGSGQHALYFASHLPQLHWYPSEISANLQALQHNLQLSMPANIAPPRALDVGDDDWQVPLMDAVFSANTLHIIGKPQVADFFRGSGQSLAAGGLVCVYGPFCYRGDFTSSSNAEFDHWLRSRDPRSGIRDFEWVDQLAESQGLTLLDDVVMPANNQLLIWRRR